MININTNKQLGNMHLGLVAVIVAVLVGAIGYIFWNNFVTKTNSSVQTKPNANQSRAVANTDKDTIRQGEYKISSGWKTYTDTDIPFTFDYPQAWVFNKSLKDVNSRGGFDQGVYRLVTLDGKIDTNDGKIVVYYRDGIGSNFQHINECFPGQEKELVPVSNGYSSEEPILVCDQKKLWELSYDEGKKKIVVITTYAIDIAVFKSLIQSIRKI